jgi:hypothetical protein
LYSPDRYRYNGKNVQLVLASDGNPLCRSRDGYVLVHFEGGMYICDPEKVQPVAKSVPQKHQYSEAEKVEDARNLIAFSTRPDELKEKKKEEKKAAEPKGEEKAFQLWMVKNRRKNRGAKRPNATAHASGPTSRWKAYNTAEVRQIYSQLGGQREPLDDLDYSAKVNNMFSSLGGEFESPGDDSN